MEIRITQAIATRDVVSASGKPGRSAGCMPWMSGQPLGDSRLRCVICGNRYEFCRCECTWCGKPKWSFEKYWRHHVCARRVS